MGRSESAIKERKLKKKKYSNIRHKGLKKRLENQSSKIKLTRRAYDVLNLNWYLLKGGRVKEPFLQVFQKEELKISGEYHSNNQQTY